MTSDEVVALRGLSTLFPAQERARELLLGCLDRQQVGGWLGEAFLWSHQYSEAELRALTDAEIQLLGSLRDRAVAAGTYSASLPAPRW